MSWTDEELMAYADGELDPERRAALGEALEHDALLRERVRTFASQRQRLSAAFAGVLEEPVPDRLTALLQAGGTAAPAATPEVVDLAAERERRAVRPPAATNTASWRQWGGMAASLALGVALGMQIDRPGTGTGNEALVSDAGGRIVASGPLARALDSALSSNATALSAGSVVVPVSFIDKDGQYCRAFSTDRVAGLACREASRWTLQTTTTAERATSGEATGQMRQASSALPRAVLEAVDARIAGNTLSTAQEQQARDRGWVR